MLHLRNRMRVDGIKCLGNSSPRRPTPHSTNPVQRCVLSRRLTVLTWLCDPDTAAPLCFPGPNPRTSACNYLDIRSCPNKDHQQSCYLSTFLSSHFLGASYLFGLPLFWNFFSFTFVILCVWTHNMYIDVGELHTVDSLLLCRFRMLNSGHPVCSMCFNSQAFSLTFLNSLILSPPCRQPLGTEAC